MEALCLLRRAALRRQQRKHSKWPYEQMKAKLLEVMRAKNARVEELLNATNSQLSERNRANPRLLRASFALDWFRTNFLSEFAAAFE